MDIAYVDYDTPNGRMAVYVDPVEKALLDDGDPSPIGSLSLDEGGDSNHRLVTADTLAPSKPVASRNLSLRHRNV